MDKDGDVTVGAPANGLAVHATVERHLKGDKVLIFKKNVVKVTRSLTVSVLTN